MFLPGRCGFMPSLSRTRKQGRFHGGRWCLISSLRHSFVSCRQRGKNVLRMEGSEARRGSELCGKHREADGRGLGVTVPLDYFSLIFLFLTNFGLNGKWQKWYKTSLL